MGTTMPWLIGIDEAGYGPNLGPFVQMAVAWQVPQGDGDLWTRLNDWITKAPHKRGDRRILIDDSKIVHQGVQGVARLARGVLSTFGAGPTLADFVSPLLSEIDAAALQLEPWYDPRESVPIANYRQLRADLSAALIESECIIGPVCARLIQPTLFNAIIDEHHSKGAVLSRGLIDLLQWMDAKLPEYEPLFVEADKQGGRQSYEGLIAEAFPTSWVRCLHEAHDLSHYRVEGRWRTVEVRFRPRADAANTAVALASMGCKYLREICMGQFNRYWQRHIPGIRRTAGYPVDALRFWREILPMVEQLGLDHATLWRKR